MVPSPFIMSEVKTPNEDMENNPISLRCLFFTLGFNIFTSCKNPQNVSNLRTTIRILKTVKNSQLMMEADNLGEVHP